MGGYFINIHHYHVLINNFIIIEVIIEADSTTTPDMDETVCYGSDEEENDSDITYVESTDKEIDNIVNNPLQHAIVQQGPSHGGANSSGANKSEANPPWAKSAGANPSWANSAGAKSRQTKP